MHNSKTKSKSIGDILKDALESNGMLQKELAEKLYVSPQAVSAWARNEKRPSKDNIKGIYQILGIDLTREMVKIEESERTALVMNKRLEDYDNYEKAKSESEFILNDIGAREKYSYPVYKLLKWLISAVIGLTYHQMLHENNDTIKYNDIKGNLGSYLNAELPHIEKDLYENELEYYFYLMGMDLFESFDEYKIDNHEYCSLAMSDWYRFKNTIIKNNASSLYCELRIAIAEIVENIQT